MGGPLWNAPTSDKDLLARALSYVEEHNTKLNTSKRIYGLLTVLHEVRSPSSVLVAHMFLGIGRSFVCYSSSAL